MQRLVLATGNPYKLTEMLPVIEQYGVEPLAQSTFFDGEVDEDGLSFVENALKKARFASAKSGLPALADDSGLEVASLGGLPGIISARYAGQGQHKPSEEENVRQLLQDLEGKPFCERKARYSCAVVYVAHERDPMPVIGIGHWYGEILKSPRTGHGVGYDDVMWIPALLKTVSELPLDEKIRLSHRTEAIHSVMTQLETNAFYD